MRKLIILLWIIPCLVFGQGKTIAFQKNMQIFNGQQSSYYLDTTSTAQTKAGQLTIEQTPTADTYTQNLYSIWTAGADMAAGGSNGIYSIAHPDKDVSNAYSLRGRMDLRGAGAAVDVNQLHAIDALINFNTSHVYDVVDNLSVYGAAVHGNGADITGDGVLDKESLNLYYGLWGSTATQDFEITTNGLLRISLHRPGRRRQPQRPAGQRPESRNLDGFDPPHRRR